jgi:hypothetical protein
MEFTGYATINVVQKIQAVCILLIIKLRSRTLRFMKFLWHIIITTTTSFELINFLVAEQDGSTPLLQIHHWARS